MRLRILGMGTKRRGTRIGNLLQAMRNGDDLKAPASPLRLTRDEQSTFRHNLRDLHARSAPMAKLVLLRLNEEMAGGPQDLPDRGPDGGAPAAAQAEPHEPLARVVSRPGRARPVHRVRSAISC